MPYVMYDAVEESFRLPIPAEYNPFTVHQDFIEIMDQVNIRTAPYLVFETEDINKNSTS